MRQRLSILSLILLCGASACAVDLSILHQQTGSQRVQTIKALRGESLGPDDVQQLLIWINQPMAYNDLTPTQQDLFFNELLETLREHDAVEPDLLVTAFTECIRNETRSVVHRDYALQHLGQLYEKTDLPQDNLDIAYETLEGDNDQLAATALRTLERAYQQRRPLDESRLKKQVLAYLEQPRGPVLHLAALHTAATLHLDQALPVIRDNVFGDTAPSRQLVALYALGELGTAQDGLDLQQLKLSHPRCELALQSAVKKLTRQF